MVAEILTLQKGFIKELFSWVDSVKLCVSLNKWKVYIFGIVKLERGGGLEGNGRRLLEGL